MDQQEEPFEDWVFYPIIEKGGKFQMVCNNLPRSAGFQASIKPVMDTLNHRVFIKTEEGWLMGETYDGRVHTDLPDGRVTPISSIPHGDLLYVVPVGP